MNDNLLSNNNQTVNRLSNNKNSLDTDLGSKNSLEKSELSSPVMRKVNNTGLPDNLKSGIESLSGYSMDDVKVHYNSDKPAQMKAHAYAQGTDIHVAPGQEQHMAHEAWHVVQQKQGRVQPTMQMKGKIPVNDDKGLESEADVMGAKAVQMGSSAVPPAQLKNSQQNSGGPLPAQLKPLKEFVEGQEQLQNEVKNDKTGKFAKQYTTVGFEHEFSQMTSGNLRGISHVEIAESKKGMPLTGVKFILETDASNALEFVSPPFLVKTLGESPLPDPEEIKDIDDLFIGRLDQLAAGTPKIGGLINTFKSEDGIDFDISRGKEVTRKNMTPNTPESVDSENNTFSKNELEDIDLKSIEKGNGTGYSGILTHVNFATDASTADMMGDTQLGINDDNYRKVFSNIENDFKDKMYELVIGRGYNNHKTQARRKRNIFHFAGKAIEDECEKVTEKFKANEGSSWVGTIFNSKVQNITGKFLSYTREVDSPNASPLKIAAIQKSFNDIVGEIIGLINEHVVMASEEGDTVDPSKEITEINKQLGVANQALTNFPVLGGGTANIKIFLNALARTLSGQLAVPSINKVREAQEARFQDSDKKMGGETNSLLIHQFLSSRVKDVKEVWVKDTIMNFGLGVLQPDDWSKVKKLVKNDAFKNFIRSYEVNCYGLDIPQEQGPEFKRLVIQSLAQLRTEINNHELKKTELRKEGGFFAMSLPHYKPKTDTSTLQIGHDQQPDLFTHDEQFISPRQDTFIDNPLKKVNMPKVWGDKRLHVVESRQDTYERLKIIRDKYDLSSKHQKSYSVESQENESLLESSNESNSQVTNNSLVPLLDTPQTTSTNQSLENFPPPGEQVKIKHVSKTLTVLSIKDLKTTFKNFPFNRPDNFDGNENATAVLGNQVYLGVIDDIKLLYMKDASQLIPIDELEDSENDENMITTTTNSNTAPVISSNIGKKQTTKSSHSPQSNDVISPSPKSNPRKKVTSRPTFRIRPGTRVQFGPGIAHMGVILSVEEVLEIGGNDISTPDNYTDLEAVAIINGDFVYVQDMDANIRIKHPSNLSPL